MYRQLIISTEALSKALRAIIDQLAVHGVLVTEHIVFPTEPTITEATCPTARSTGASVAARTAFGRRHHRPLL